MKNIISQGEDPWTTEQHKPSATISLEVKTSRETAKHWDKIQFVSLDIFKTQWTNGDDWASFRQGVGIRASEAPCNL